MFVVLDRQDVEVEVTKGRIGDIEYSLERRGTKIARPVLPKGELFLSILMDCAWIKAELFHDRLEVRVKTGIERERVRKTEGASDGHPRFEFFRKERLENSPFHLVARSKSAVPGKSLTMIIIDNSLA